MKHPWMPFYVQDFQIDTMDLEVDEVGVYVTLLCLTWQRGGFLPADEPSLRKILKRCFATFHGHTYNRIVPKLLAIFRLGGAWIHEQKADKREAKGRQTVRKAKTKRRQTMGRL